MIMVRKSDQWLLSLIKKHSWLLISLLILLGSEIMVWLLSLVWHQSLLRDYLQVVGVAAALFSAIIFLIRTYSNPPSFDTNDSGNLDALSWSLLVIFFINVLVVLLP